LSGTAASGKWVNISQKGISWGNYSSAEAGSDISTPGAGAGFEASVLFTSDTDAALSGIYMANGVDGALVSGDIITTLPSSDGAAITGLQISGDVVGVPTDFGGHSRTGVGTFETTGEKNWKQIAVDTVDAVADAIRMALKNDH